MMICRLWGIFMILTLIVNKNAFANDVDGGWSTWSVYTSPCNATCGGGVATSFRSCSNPVRQGNGLLCLKTDNTRAVFESKSVPCNTHSCFDGLWSNWTECDNCTIGIRFRESMCSYTEVCQPYDDLYKKVEEDCNRWDKKICPSPCETTKCPEYGVCNDMSTDEGPATECACTMDRKLNDAGTACVRPAPTTPKPKPIPSLPPAQKTVATVMSKGASSVLIVFVTITLVLFFVLRIFSPDRIIQMNMEIALVSAHIFLMFPPSIVESEFMCKLVSIMIHYFFTACYCFMMLEALHMYFLVAYIVKKDGAFSKLQNTLIGWILAAAIVLCCISFEIDNYGGKYHCWLQMDTSLAYGVFIPVIVIVVVTFTLIEAAGAASNKPVPEYDRKQRLSATISQRTNLIILPFILAHWIVGMMSEYEQNLALYGTFTVLNGITGFLVFFFHCSNNQQVRDKLKKAAKKMSNGASY